ncbi:unnamed protein product [Protopolystoma xenopodis]|uniref:Uncharacterized protein n=1 Tax=Protopolystoma xenopodis TaxID=117903 RepID=A0A3S5C337_9PLAT|nr:unnamed protein product [Protopolystoma xenopodis]
MEYITQFTGKVRYLKRADNIVADTLSHIDMASVVPDTRINYPAMAEEQKREYSQIIACQWLKNDDDASRDASRCQDLVLFVNGKTSSFRFYRHAEIGNLCE